MRVFYPFLICACFIFHTCIAQKSEIYKVMDGNTFYCSYYKLGQPIHNLAFAYNRPNDQTAYSNDFSDVMYRNENGDQLIYMTAKVLSSNKLKTLNRYYNISFTGIEEELRIPYTEYAIEYFTNSILKYKVLKNGNIDAAAVQHLFAFWNKKANAIDEALIMEGSSCVYNSSPYTIDKFIDTSFIKIHGDSIYCGPAFFCTYKAGTMAYATSQASQEDFFFYLRDAKGLQIAKIKLERELPFIYVSSPYFNETLRMYTPVREEKRIMLAVTKFITAFGGKELAGCNSKR